MRRGAVPGGISSGAYRRIGKRSAMKAPRVAGSLRPRHGSCRRSYAASNLLRDYNFYALGAHVV